MTGRQYANMKKVYLCTHSGLIDIAVDSDDGFLKLVNALFAHPEDIPRLLEEGVNLELTDDSGDTILMLAVRSGNADVVKALLDAGSKVDVQNSQEETALRLAAAAGMTEIVEAVIAHGADIDLADNRGVTPLISAVKNAHKDVVRCLVEAKANIDLTDGLNLTAVSHAVTLNDVDILEILLKGGGNPNATDRYRCNALIRAADAGRDAIIKCLVHSGADVHTPTKYGDSALIYASQFCQAETVQLLIDYGAKIDHVNDRGETALYLAADRGRADIIPVLVAAGANINHRKIDGNTALMIAARRGCDVIKEIIQARAKLNLRNCSGNTALIIAASLGSFHSVVCLVQAGVDIEVTNNEGESAIMTAARCNRNKTFIYLLRCGAKVDIVHKNSTSNTVLMYACACLMDTVNFLIHSRTSDEMLIHHVNWTGDTALTFAASAGLLEVVRYLVSKGSDVNVVTKTGDTPLILAASVKTDLDVIRHLVENGADVNARNKSGVTALHHAVRRNLPNVVEYLLWKGTHVTSEIHLAASLGRHNIVQVLMQNGASPSLQNLQNFYVPEYSAMSPVSLGPMEEFPIQNVLEVPLFNINISPLAVALLWGHADLAKYFISNWFLSWFDVTELHRMTAIQNHLQARGWQDCLTILDTLSSQPWSLQTLSFVATSAAMGYSSDRAEKIQMAKLPEVFQRRLQFRDKSSFEKMDTWRDIVIHI